MGDYDELVTTSQMVRVTDDDKLGVTITEPKGGLDVVEEGDGGKGGKHATYDVALDRDPVATVTVTVRATQDLLIRRGGHDRPVDPAADAHLPAGWVAAAA